mgnify:CR=1 FL=1
MRSSRSIILTKQRMRICRSVTVQDSSPDGGNIKQKTDRASSTMNMNMNNTEW